MNRCTIRCGSLDAPSDRTLRTSGLESSKAYAARVALRAASTALIEFCTALSAWRIAPAKLQEQGTIVDKASRTQISIF